MLLISLRLFVLCTRRHIHIHLNISSHRLHASQKCFKDMQFEYGFHIIRRRRRAFWSISSLCKNNFALRSAQWRISINIQSILILRPITDRNSLTARFRLQGRLFQRVNIDVCGLALFLMRHIYPPVGQELVELRVWPQNRPLSFDVSPITSHFASVHELIFRYISSGIYASCFFVYSESPKWFQTALFKMFSSSAIETVLTPW